MKKPGIIPVVIIDFAFTVAVIIIVNVVIVNLARTFTGIMNATMLEKIVNLPQFDVEFGNQIYEVYMQFSYVIIIIFVGIVIVCTVMRLSNYETKFWTEKAKQASLYIVIILVFPYVWDEGTDLMSAGTQFLLNPVYSFDPNSPCPEEWDNNKIRENYDDSPYSKDKLPGWSYWFDLDVEKAEDACRPEFKLHYLISQMSQGQHYRIEVDNPLEWITSMVTGFAEDFFSDAFLGVVKAIVTINISIMALLVALMSDLLTGMIIAALPILLLLKMIKPFNRIADTMIDSLPALFLVPLMSGIIIVVGAAVVASAHTAPIAGEQFGPLSSTAIYVWITSIGTLFFAVSLPLLMVPLLGDITNKANMVVTGAITSAVMMTSTAGGGLMKKMSPKSSSEGEDSDGDSEGEDSDEEGSDDKESNGRKKHDIR